MKGWIIDASIALSWVYPEQATVEAEGLLEKIAGGAVIVVPSLWFTEVANSLLVLQRRKRITVKERATALRMLASLRIERDEESSRAAFSEVSELAEKYGLSVYDATYLELAVRRKLALASRDAPLNKAAKACGVDVL